MPFLESRSRSTTGGSSVVIVIVMAVFLAGLGSAVLSQEIKEQKPKKPRFEKNDITVTDNVTELTWTASGNAAGQQFSWDGAFVYIDDLNREKFGGHRNWRLPSKEELLTLVGHVKSQGFDGRAPDRTVAAGLAMLGFEHVQEGGYWSSTEYLYFDAEAWAVDMKSGAVSVGVKTLYYSIWPVRSARSGSAAHPANLAGKAEVRRSSP